MITLTFEEYCASLDLDGACNLYENLQYYSQYISMSWLPNYADRVIQEKDLRETLAKLNFLSDLIEKLK